MFLCCLLPNSYIATSAVSLQEHRKKLVLEGGAFDSSLIQKVPMLLHKQTAEAQLDTQQVIFILAAGVTVRLTRRNSRNSSHASATNAQLELLEQILVTHEETAASPQLSGVHPK